MVRRSDSSNTREPGPATEGTAVFGAATRLMITVPDTVDAAELEGEIVTAVADRLRDDQGYELPAAGYADARGRGHEYHLHPDGRILVTSAPGTLTVSLHGIRVDANDLFTGVSSELEQRHEGLRVNIG